MRRFKLGYIIIAGVLVIGALFLLYRFNPIETAIFLPCPLHYATGYYCPGCGSLRATHALLHGHVRDAMSLNPLMVLSIPVLGVMFFHPSWVYKRWVPWAAFWILILYGILRNIPVWPFTVLAPQ